MEKLNVEEIQQRLPHRHPFLLVDQVEILESGEKVSGIKAITFTEPCFAGHFPGQAVFPGSLVIEAASQTAGFLLPAAGVMQGFVAEVSNFRFMKKITPGVLLRITASKKMKKGPYLAAFIQAHVEQELMAEGEMILYIAPQKEDRLG